jgi:diguanylate cyclase (GGDEF)-like protein/PAS domain S-box-containing protein
MKELFRKLLDSGDLLPHMPDSLWKPEGMWLHIGSDLLISLAYYLISIALLYLVYKRRDLPLKEIFLLFGAFLLISGTTQFIEVWTLWHPSDWLSGCLNAIAAAIALYTVVKLFSLIPQILASPNHADLEATNQKLAAEMIERQQAIKKLQDSEARFRSIFEGAAIGIALVDMEGQVVATNPALQRILGYKDYKEDNPARAEEAINAVSADWQRYEELISGKRSDTTLTKRYLGKDGHLSQDSDYYQMEKRYLGKDGQLHWCHITASIVRDADGKPQFGIRMLEDITARKQSEATLKQHHQHLEKLVGERTAELTQVNEKLSWQASHDELTRLINRRAFEECLGELVVNAQRHHQKHTLCYFDLDRFKIVNDTCGHVAGDELLRQLSTLLQSQVRKTDVLARLGGDEFGLLLYHCTLEQALPVVQMLHEAIQTFRFTWEDKSFSIGASIGLITMNAETKSLDSVLSAVDAACYQAKNRGRNRIHIYQPDDDELAQQRNQGQWVARINQAIAFSESSSYADHHFCLYYQPIVPLEKKSSEASLPESYEHYEVLLRLIDDTGQIIPPMAFLPAAERYNLMPAIDRWVIRTFLAMLSQQSRDNWEHCIYAINISGASVNDDQFINFLKEQFATYGIPPQVICFELTESLAMANRNKAFALIRDIKELGCRFALDDFGSGMSSLAYLKHLPVDYLKIDETLIKGIANDPIAGVMVEAISRLGHIIGIETIAEFVTDKLTLQEVKALGVNYAQGYGIAAPHPLLSQEQQAWKPNPQLEPSM